MLTRGSCVVCGVMQKGASASPTNATRRQFRSGALVLVQHRRSSGSRAACQHRTRLPPPPPSPPRWPRRPAPPPPRPRLARAGKYPIAFSFVLKPNSPLTPLLAISPQSGSIEPGKDVKVEVAWNKAKSLKWVTGSQGSTFRGCHMALAVRHMHLHVLV